MTFDPRPLLAVSPQPAGAGGTSFFSTLLMMTLIFGVFYFLLIAPARKKQRQHGEMLAGLKNGDKVVTSGGIYGTVVGVTDRVVQLRVADQVKIEVRKEAIAELQAGQE